MIKKTKWILLAFVILCMFSCTKNQLFRETHQDFPMNRWFANDVQEFNVKIVNTNLSYNFILNFGYVYGTQFNQIPITATLVYPSGKKETIPFELSLLNDNNEEAGNCLGDLCDIQYVFKPDVLLQEQGEYTVRIKNTFANDFLPNVLAVGLVLEKAE